MDIKEERVHIFMLTFNAPEVEIPCVESIIKNTQHPYILELYDNRPQNDFFSILWNHLIKRSPCNYFCFLNSDTILPAGWLSKLMDIYAMVEGDPPSQTLISGVGPVTNSAVSTQRGRKGPGEFKLHTDWRIAGFCFIISRRAFELVGPFDEEFQFYGQEEEWFYRAHKLYGLKAYFREDVFVYHKHGATISQNPDFNKAQRELGLEIFLKKKKEIDKLAQQKGK